MQFYHDWLHFFPTTLYPREKKYLVVLGLGELAPQAGALSIAPWLLGHPLLNL